MKRLLLLAVLSIAALPGQEAAHDAAAQSHEPGIGWKWANFILLAGALGYLGKKHLGPFFSARSTRIQSGLVEAQKLRESSEARVLEIEKKVANLDADMKSLRETARQEMAAEGDRVRRETARAIARIQANAEQEITAALKHARQELKAYSADLAVQLAAGQIRERIDGTTQQKLVDIFVSQLAKAQKVTH